MARAHWIEKGYNEFGYVIQHKLTGEKREFATYEEALDFMKHACKLEDLDEYARLHESVELARSVGVPEDKILHNLEEIDKFFQDGEGV